MNFFRLDVEAEVDEGREDSAARADRSEARIADGPDRDNMVEIL